MLDVNKEINKEELGITDISTITGQQYQNN
jgi:hypothetical protein